MANSIDKAEVLDQIIKIQEKGAKAKDLEELKQVLVETLAAMRKLAKIVEDSPGWFDLR